MCLSKFDLENIQIYCSISMITVKNKLFSMKIEGSFPVEAVLFTQMLKTYILLCVQFSHLDQKR